MPRKKPFSHYQQKLSFSDTAINTWAERDEGYVILENKHTGKNLLEWRGVDDINQAVEDGFLPFFPDSRGHGDAALHRAAWDYYQSLRRNPRRRRTSRRNPNYGTPQDINSLALDASYEQANGKHIALPGRGTWIFRARHDRRNGWDIWLSPTRSAKNTADYQATKHKLHDDFIISLTSSDDWPPHVTKLLTSYYNRMQKKLRAG